MTRLRRLLLSFFILVGAESTAAAETKYDVIIYGATPAGIMGALSAKAHGAAVLLLEPGNFAGGMISGGLGATDIGDPRSIGGSTRNFFERIGKHYGKPLSWSVEPKVARATFEEILREHSVPLIKKWVLKSVRQTSGRIEQITNEQNSSLSGRIFVDASYEGDLMALAGVRYRTGREAEAEFQEPLAGVRKEISSERFKSALSPLDSAGKLLPGINQTPIAPEGSADDGIPAYNYRLCVTKNPDNRRAFTKPADYQAQQFELLRRYLQSKPDIELSGLLNFLDLPGKKYDLNNRGPFSTDLIGGSKKYPNARPAERKQIAVEHERYTKGLLWFLSTDESVPAQVRTDLEQWGLCKDEFTDNDNWPTQLYVREARRMEGAYFMTQKDIRDERTKNDSVGLGSSPIESHHVQRYVAADGSAQNEGYVYTRRDRKDPYEIPYRALLPKKEQCSNLIVPVALSASHIAYSSIRMEPVFMILGESAGTAAALALREKTTVQDLPIELLQSELKQQKQFISFPR